MIRHLVSHYDWLDKYLAKFFDLCEVPPEESIGMASAHGDKCFQYRDYWQQLGIKFEHGVAIYLLTYTSKFASHVRETRNGWVAPREWVVANRETFVPICSRLEGEDI
jgi:hypothetical protein